MGLTQWPVLAAPARAPDLHEIRPPESSANIIAFADLTTFVERGGRGGVVTAVFG